MNKSQLQNKIKMLPVLVDVTVDNSTNDDGEPVLEVSYDTVPGPGSVVLQVDISPTEEQLTHLANNLPLAQSDRLAALAILLVAPLPV